jgi:parallel beta-helix repeat protein
MKLKLKIISLMILGTVFVLSPIIKGNFNFTTGISDKSSEYGDEITLDNENLKISEVSGKIHILGDQGWVDFHDEGNCSGSGIFNDPYVIKDLVIDGEGSGSCILIENSKVYFRIENCTVFNSDKGIELNNVNNGSIFINNCSYNNGWGIHLIGNSNNISNNYISNNYQAGIYVYYSYYNTILNNV